MVVDRVVDSVVGSLIDRVVDRAWCRTSSVLEINRLCRVWIFWISSKVAGSDPVLERREEGRGERGEERKGR